MELAGEDGPDSRAGLPLWCAVLPGETAADREDAAQNIHGSNVQRGAAPRLLGAVGLHHSHRGHGAWAYTVDPEHSYAYGASARHPGAGLDHRVDGRWPLLRGTHRGAPLAGDLAAELYTLVGRRTVRPGNDALPPGGLRCRHQLRCGCLLLLAPHVRHYVGEVPRRWRIFT